MLLPLYKATRNHIRGGARWLNVTHLNFTNGLTAANHIKDRVFDDTLVVALVDGNVPPARID